MTELIWDGKYRDDKRVAPVKIALPLQTVETVNESAQERQRSLDLFASRGATDWRNRLVWGDRKYVLPSLLPEFAGKVDLVYIDPPFDTGADFSFRSRIPGTDSAFDKAPSVIEVKAYRDTWGVTEEERRRGVSSLDKYMRWFSDTALLLQEFLSERGLLFVHLDDNVVHEAKVALDQIFGREHFRGEIIWQLGTGAKSRKFFSIQHNTILVYSAGEEWTFNPDDPLAREPFADGSVATHFRKVDENGRRYRVRNVNGKDYTYYEDEGRLLGSVWSDISSMSANSPILAEATGYPTQKPEKLLERIIATCTRPNDLVLDCFCGSGTSAIAAEKLGRRWIASDLGRFAIHTTRKRLLATAGVKPFVIQNLGKYERAAWMAAQFDSPQDQAAAEDAYRRFILQLFHAQPLEGHPWIHGSKATRLVHVGSVDAPVTVADVKAIARDALRLRGSHEQEFIQVDVLGWEFAFELVEMAKQLAAEASVDITFKRIPRDVLDRRAIEQGDVQAKDFFELRVFSTDHRLKGKLLSLEVSDFTMPSEDLPDDVVKAIDHWSQWIDYWAIDWDYRNDTFHNAWQSYRTRTEPKLQLSAQHQYKEPGSYTVVVKIIDLLGCDTTKMLTIEVT